MNDDERDALIRRIEDRRSKGALGPLQLSREEEDLVHYALTRAQDADRYEADLQGATDATTTAKAGKAADEKLGLIKALTNCLRDDRQAGKVKHSLGEALGQRVFGIALGYPDANDAARLADDPMEV